MSAIQKNPFLKYVMKDEKKDIFHSSAYAKAQSGGAIGAASFESYDVRVNINQNRTRVRKYSDSRLMTGAMMNGPKAKAYTPPEKDAGILAKNSAPAAGKSAVPVKNSGISMKKPGMPAKNSGISPKR